MWNRRKRFGSRGMGACAVVTLCLVFMNVHGWDLPSLDWSLVERRLAGRRSDDCNHFPDQNLPTSLRASNVTATLLPEATGLSLSWYSVINISEFLGGVVTYAPIFQIQRLVTKTNAGVTNYTECRTFLLNASAFLTDPSATILVFFNYSWTHSGIIAPGAYDIVLLSPSAGEESEVSSFRLSLFLSSAWWPKLVALNLLPSCDDTSTVFLSFDPIQPSDRKYYEFDACLFDPKIGSSFSYCEKLNYTRNTVAFQRVLPFTYDVSVTFISSFPLCPCAENDDGACNICGNQLNGVQYTVPAFMPKRWQADATLSRRCAAVTEECCLQLDFRLADASLKYYGYNVSFLQSVASNAAKQTVLTVWTPTNRASICNVSSGWYTAEIIPDGECREWITTSVSNHLEIDGCYAGIWNRSINATYHEATNGNVCVLISFVDEYKFTAYNISIRGAVATAQQTSATVSNRMLEQSIISYNNCGIYTGEVIVEVTPVGSCPKNIGTASQKISIPNGIGEELTAGQLVGVTLGCIIFIASILSVVIWWCKGRPMLARTGKWGTFNCKYNVGTDSASSLFPEIKSTNDEINMFIGGQSPLVLLLYSADHKHHVKIVTALAEILETFVGCKVILDKWCDSESVQMNSWLQSKLFSVDKVVVVASEGACILHRAFNSAQHFPKFSMKHSSCHHISEALVLASKYPVIRQKLIFVTFAYSPDSSVSGLLDGFEEQPRYQLFEDMSNLVGVLHCAVGPYQWCCQAPFERSTKLQKVKKLIKKMLDKVNHRPSFISDSFGPASARFDSGIDHSAFTRSEFASDEQSAGRTEVLTIFCSSLEPISKFSNDSGYAINEDRANDQAAVPPLPTVMPDTEEIWGTYIEPEPSPVGSLTSEQLRIALKHLNSDHFSSFYDSQPLGDSGDSQSDISLASCITIDRDQITFQP